MMNRLLLWLAFLTLSTVTFSASAAPGEKLSPLAFLAGRDWEAKLPDSPEGKKVSIRAHFAWGQNHQSIIFSSGRVIDGKSTPYVDGMYVWNPEKRAIAIIYSEGDGTLTEGTVQLKEGKLVHEFRQIHPDGRIEEYLSELTPQGTQSWTNEIYSRNGDQLKQIVKVQYLALK